MHHINPGRRRILVIDGHALFAEALELTLAGAGHDVRRLTLPSNGSLASLRAAALRQRPGIVLLGHDLGRFGDATSLVTSLSRSGTAVVVLTRSLDRADWGECVELGAATVLPAGASLSELLGTIRSLERGLPVLDPHERTAWLAELHREPDAEQEWREGLRLLTPRERAILKSLVQGRSVTEIAASGVVAEATVRTQVKSVLAKLGVSSQLAAVAAADRAGWSVRS